MTVSATNSVLPSADVWRSVAETTGKWSVAAASGFIWLTQSPIASDLGRVPVYAGLFAVGIAAFNTPSGRLVSAAKAHIIITAAAFWIWKVIGTQISLPTEPAAAKAAPILSTVGMATLIFPAAATVIVTSIAVAKAARELHEPTEARPQP